MGFRLGHYPGLDQGNTTLHNSFSITTNSDSIAMSPCRSRMYSSGLHSVKNNSHCCVSANGRCGTPLNYVRIRRVPG
jgi:hypothetical protein